MATYWRPLFQSRVRPPSPSDVCWMQPALPAQPSARNTTAIASNTRSGVQNRVRPISAW